MKIKDSILGKLVILEGIILLIPLIIIPCYPSEIKFINAFILPSVLSIILGLIICHYNINIKNSNRLVTIIWLLSITISSIPFILKENISLIQAVFESVSGYTTTGLSTLDVDQLPHIYLFYRAFLQYVGGLGFVLTMLIFIQEKNSAILYHTEGHPDRLMPCIQKSAKVIGKMYILFLIIGTISYTIFKMPLFDSITHAMCALSTGGFSNRIDSIAYYNSLPIEIITVILMLIGTTNFSLLLLLIKGRIKDFFKASEIRFLLLIIIITIPLLSIVLISSNIGILESIRLAIFNAFSAISTTGYATCSYTTWPQCALGIMILLMLIGGGLGSTAGGIKLSRVCIIIKDLISNIRKKFVSNRTIMLTYYHNGNEKAILAKDQIEEASTYALSYILIFILGTFLLTYFANCSLVEGAFEFASSLGTVGLSIGITNINTNTICLIIEIIGMILGRLEIFVIFKALK